MNETKTSEIEFIGGPWDGKVVGFGGTPHIWVCVVMSVPNPAPTGRPVQKIEHFYYLITPVGRLDAYIYSGYDHPRIEAA